MSLNINPLANPRGTKLTCELCQKSAFSQCTHCRVTFYCGREHQAQDWDGIHSKVCGMLAKLRAPKPYMNSDLQRDQYARTRAERQKELVALTSGEAQRLLYGGQPDRALPAAQLSLRSSTELFGTGKVELIPALVVLAECCVGVGLLDKGEQYLSQAKWSAANVEDCPVYLLSQVNRVLGRLYVAKGDHAQAMTYLAEDVFYASVEYGPEHIKTSGGYFEMARSFLQAGDQSAATSLFLQVISIWYKFLQERLAEHTKPKAVKKKGSRPSLLDKEKVELSPFDEIGKVLDEGQKAEAVYMLLETVQKFSVGILPCSENERWQCHHSAAIVCAVGRRREEAYRHHQEALKLRRAAAGGEKDPEFLAELTLLGELFDKFADAVPTVDN